MGQQETTGDFEETTWNIPIFAVRAWRICGRVVAVDWAVDASVWAPEVENEELAFVIQILQHSVCSLYIFDAENVKLLNLRGTAHCSVVCSAELPDRIQCTPVIFCAVAGTF